MVAIVSEKIYLGSAKPGSGGSAPVIDELNVTPSTSAQVITAPSGTDGYSPVNVSAVTSAIDANITAGNIKKDVSILGVTGSYEGNVPTGTMYIISNGTYNVADKAIANVQVPTTAPAHYIEKSVDANGKLNNNTQNFMSFAGVTDIGDRVCFYSYYSNNSITSANFGSLTTITGTSACSYMFDSSNVSSVDLSNLTTITGTNACSYMFNYSNVSSVDLSNVTTITGYRCCENMFNHTKISNLNLHSLVTVGEQSLANFCSNTPLLTNVDLSSLKTVGTKGLRYAFLSDTNLQTLSFPSLTTVAADSFQAMLNNVTGCTIHFPSNLSGTTGLDSTTIGGTNTTVLFDLPATE